MLIFTSLMPPLPLIQGTTPFSLLLLPTLLTELPSLAAHFWLKMAVSGK